MVGDSGRKGLWNPLRLLAASVRVGIATGHRTACLLFFSLSLFRAPPPNPIETLVLTCFFFCFVAPDAKAKQAKKAALKGTNSTSLRKVRTSVTFKRPSTLRLPRAPKYARKSVPHMPRMDAHSVLKHPLNSESAMRSIETANTLVFIVDLKSNKRQIKQAIEQVYNVKAAHVHTLIRPSGDKKAYIKLTPDHDALDCANNMGLI